MKEVLREKSFWIAVLAVFLGIAAGLPLFHMELPLAAGSFLDYYKKALEAKILLFLIPIAAVLPAGAVYVRESSGGFLKFYITRIGRNAYIARKLVQIYLSGFFIFCLAGLFVLLICFLCIYPLEIKDTIPPDKVWDALAPLLRISLTGGIFSGFSGIFAAAFQNYYMAYGLPFVCYYLLIIIHERYLPDLYTIYPSEWIQCKQYWGNTNSGIWVFLLLFSAAVMLLNSLLLHYRPQEV